MHIAYEDFTHFVGCRKGTKRFRRALAIDRLKISKGDFSITATWKAKVNLDEGAYFWRKAFRSWFYLPLDADLRAFQLRIINRQLGCGHKLAQHTKGLETRCRLCLLKGQVNDETIEHILFDCKITKGILKELKLWYPLKEQGVNFEIADYLVWEERDTRREETFCNSVYLLTKYYVWTCRMGPRLPMIMQAKSYIRCNVRIVSNLLDRQGKPNPFTRLAEAELCRDDPDLAE